jgi:hypothetical protein
MQVRNTHWHPLWVVALGAVLLLSACSGVKTYSSDLPTNLRVRTYIDTGSAMRSTVAEFDVHYVDRNCSLQHQGRVYLDQPLVEVGIPAGRLVYLDFIFASKAVLSSQISGTRHGILLTPRAGHDYDAKVTYDRGIYDVVLRGNGRIVPRKTLSDCRGGSVR